MRRLFVSPTGPAKAGKKRQAKVDSGNGSGVEKEGAKRVISKKEDLGH
jgi:hypothetical protein